MDYKQIRKTKEFQDDNNCCVPVAFSIAFDVPFAKMQKEFFKLGRRRYSGTRGDIWVPYLYKCGKIYNKEVKQVIKYKGMTINNFYEFYPSGVYIAGVNGHLLTIVDGVAEDWTENRFHRIEAGRLWKIGEDEEIKINRKRKLSSLFDMD
tara:strand:- start:47 stop:496 length:450 start_codon:yes stop_codon:yes gene_type:complete